MNERSFDALTRRASLFTLGVVGLGVLVNPSAAAAKKKKDDKKARKRCRAQVAQCTTLVTDGCADNPECLKGLDCCDFAGRCDFTGFLNCLLATVA